MRKTIVIHKKQQDHVPGRKNRRTLPRSVPETGPTVSRDDSVADATALHRRPRAASISCRHRAPATRAAFVRRFPARAAARPASANPTHARGANHSHHIRVATTTLKSNPTMPKTGFNSACSIHPSIGAHVRIPSRSVPHNSFGSTALHELQDQWYQSRRQITQTSVGLMALQMLK
jgi:hypothetical protein